LATPWTYFLHLTSVLCPAHPNLICIFGTLYVLGDVIVANVITDIVVDDVIGDVIDDVITM